jgi:hypothetical protein
MDRSEEGSVSIKVAGFWRRPEESIEVLVGTESDSSHCLIYEVHGPN